MVPIVLDGARVPLALIGRGPELARRADWLLAGGAGRLTVYTDAPTAELEAKVGPALVARWPTAAEMAGVRATWITGLPSPEAAPLADLARRLGVLANVEDVTVECDFHTPAVVRRDELLLTVSTGGRAPGLAARVRGWLEREFGPEWAERLDLVARKRGAWRRRPRELAELARLTDAVVDHQGWLDRGEEVRR